MSSEIHAYAPPINDMLHALEAAGAGDINATEFGLNGDGTINTEDLQMILESAGDVAANHWAPYNRVADQESQVTFVPATEEGKYNEVHFGKNLKKGWDEYRNTGLFGVTAPEEYGGMGAPSIISMPLKEMFNAANIGLCLGPLLTEGVIENISLNAPEPVKKMFLASLAAGDTSGTMLLTEENYGSDLGRITTTAEKQEGGTYKLKGKKIFITHGEHDATGNILSMVLVRTGSIEDGVKGLSLMAVPKYMVEENGTITDKRNGIEAIEMHEKMGIHSSPTMVMELGGDKGACHGYLIGEEGQGMKLMFGLMNSARQGVGLSGMAVGDRARQAHFRYAAQRRQGNHINAIGDKTNQDLKNVHIIKHASQREFQVVSDARLMASRLICYHASIQNSLSHTSTDEAIRKKAVAVDALFTPIAKAGSTETGYQIASTSLEKTGGYGFMEESGFPQYVRDATIPKIYEGTNSIQALDLVGRKVLRDSGNIMSEWIKDSRSTLAVGFEKYGGEHTIYENTLESLHALEKATQSILELGMRGKLEEATGTAEHYLTLFDRVAGGVMMARSASVAHGKAQTPETTHYINQAQVYADNVLPEVSALKTKVKNGIKSILKSNLDHMINRDQVTFSP